LAFAYLTTNLLAPDGSNVPRALPRAVLTLRAADPVRGHKNFLRIGSWQSNLLGSIDANCKWLVFGKGEANDDEIRRDEKRIFGATIPSVEENRKITRRRKAQLRNKLRSVDVYMDPSIQGAEGR